MCVCLYVLVVITYDLRYAVLVFVLLQEQAKGRIICDCRRKIMLAGAVACDVTCATPHVCCRCHAAQRLQPQPYDLDL